MGKGRVGIRFIFKLYFTILVGEEKHLACRVATAAVELVRFEHIFDIEVAHPTATPVQGVIAREVGHEATENFYPKIMVVSVEQVDCPLIHLRRIYRETPLAVIVEE